MLAYCADRTVDACCSDVCCTCLSPGYATHFSAVDHAGAALIALIVGGVFCIRRARRRGESEDGLPELVKRNDSLIYGPGRGFSVTSKGGGDGDVVDVEALRMFDRYDRAHV